MQEAIFRLFGYYKFIQTQPPEKRDALLKPNIEQLDDDDDVFYNNIIDYYQSRPSALENLTLASFAADFEYYKTSQKPDVRNKDQPVPNENIVDDALQEDDNDEEAGNIIDSHILLRNNMGHLRRRRKRAIIRYYRGREEDEEKQIRSIMLLFHPFRNEVTEV